MADEELIRELLEELMESGATPEDVCGGHPELLAEVRRRWRRVRSVSSQIETLFPSRAAAAAQPKTPLTDAPQIPGYDGVTFVGRGGMGVVYRARHAALSRTVAVKMLLPGVGGAASDATEALLREAEAVAALQHPNIVQVFDVGTHEGRAYFTMEFLSGGSLAQKTAGVPQPPRRAAEMVVTLASAVQAAHDGGIVHRDIKPGNILFAADGTVKLADFSLARRIAGDPAVTQGPGVIGTPSYMAPEQALGRSSRCDPLVDVYALGAVLYDLLTGRPPFRADSPAETHRQVVEEDPAPPTRLNARVPRDLETICLTCLQKDPQRRYRSADELVGDLRRFLAGQPITARRAGVVERATKWARRRPAHAMLAACTALAIAAGIAGAFWFGSRRAAVVAAVNADLDRIVSMEEAGRWSEARQLISLANTRLGNGGPDELRARLSRAEAGIALVDRLDAVCMDRAASTELKFDREASSLRYEQAFKDAGLILSPDEPVTVIAERIRGSPVHAAIVYALNDWATCSTDKGDLQRRLQIARLADPDPAWRNRMRSVNVWQDPAALRELARTAPTDPQAAALSPILASLLEANGDDPLDLLRRMQAANPADFWTNFRLAECLDTRGNAGAIGYYRAARALRPDSVAAVVNLGTALVNQGFIDEAEGCWRRAIEMEPSCAPAYLNLAVTALNDERPADALPLAEQAVKFNDRWPLLFSVLGDALGRLGRFDEAAPALKRAVSMLPEGDPARSEVVSLMRRFAYLQQLDERLADYVSGGKVASGAEEAFAVGDLLRRHGDALAAARFYADGVEIDPVAAANPASRRKYCAARAAATASTAPGGSAEERARYRAHALEWLTEELKGWNELAAAGDAGVRTSVRLAVERWKKEPGLAPVREGGSLAGLEGHEAQKWRGFWADVDSLLARIDPASAASR